MRQHLWQSSPKKPRRTIVDDGGEEVVCAVHAGVDGEQEADQDLVRKHQRSLCHVEAVSCEGCRRY
jgi:hypothetical protein